MFKALKKYKELPQWIQDTVMPIVEGGSHWFHPENVKLAMLADSRIEVRRKAIDLILEDRKNPYQQKKPKSGKGSEKKVWIFNLPQLSYDADTYDQVLDWKTAERLEPPFLHDHSDEDIRKYEESPLDIPVPHHTQYVERAIRVVTDCGTRAASLELREGMAKATFRSRKAMPKCETKKD